MDPEYQGISWKDEHLNIMEIEQIPVSACRNSATFLDKSLDISIPYWFLFLHAEIPLLFWTSLWAWCLFGCKKYPEAGDGATESC